METAAKLVRYVQRGERWSDLVNEAKARAWAANAEFGLVRLITGERALISGGEKEIQFLLSSDEKEVFIIIGGELVRVRRLLFHTHPRATGPSDGDLRFLRLLGQTRSQLYELGGPTEGTIIRPK